MNKSHAAETVELEAMRDLHAAADQSDIDYLGLLGLNLGSAFVSLARNLPDSAIVINRTLGLGLAAPATRDEFETIVAAYRDNHVAQYFVHLHPDARPAQLPEWMRAAGLKPDRAWQKFSREPFEVVDRTTDLEVREIGQDFGIAFAEIVCAAFDIGETAVPWLARLPGRKDWHVFMSFDGDTPAGVGALFVRDGFGWTDYGATAPEFRRRGSQATVMAARLQRANDLGCKNVFTCTGVSVPGDPQHSYNNILKSGFTESYIRENYVPA